MLRRNDDGAVLQIEVEEVFPARAGMNRSASRALASRNTRRYAALRVTLIVTPTAKSPTAMGYLFAASLHLCLWAGLCVLMWDADHWADEWFGTALAAYVVSLILLLPAAFCIGLIVRTAEALWETASWARDVWRYRRRAP